MLNKDNIICSKGFINNNYKNSRTEFIRSEESIIKLINENNNVIFIKSGSKNIVTDLDFFADNLNQLKKPIILITSDGDRSIPSSYDINIINKILNCNNIKKWYTQNYDKTIIHEKLDYYPIGFDLHTTRWLIDNNTNDKINFMIECRHKSSVFNRIKNKIFCDFHLHYSHKSRKELYENMKNNKYLNFINSKKSFQDITLEYNKYNFALSPRGNGLDCHRTWELFLAGVIVITLTSSLDNMFIKNNLPVIILKDWNELNDINHEKLKYMFKKNVKKIHIKNIFPKLKYKYWIK